jgi:low temperature requirement protein LtrA
MLGPAHFVERHGLVVIIALGESVVAVGIGASGLPIDLALVGVAVLGLLLSACLWWTYFGGDDVQHAEAALANAFPAARRQRLAVDGFGYWHLPILFGIIATAASLKHAIGHASDDLTTQQALLLGIGVALYLVGDVFFRRTLGIGHGPWRLVAAALALVTIPLGLGVAAVAQLGALVLVLGGALVAEQTAGRGAYLSGRSG